MLVLAADAGALLLADAVTDRAIVVDGFGWALLTALLLSALVTAAAHLLCSDSFGNAPDVWVGSFYDPELEDACAFEELIEFHGGLGGQQTQPSLLVPAELPLPDAPIVGAAAVNELLQGCAPAAPSARVAAGRQPEEDREVSERAQTRFVSTGHLPPPESVATLVAEAHETFRTNADGRCSQVYPAPARVPRELFGVCVVGTDGTVNASGEAECEFSIMSVAKPFVFALVCQQLGANETRQKLGVNATGLSFNSLTAIEQGDGRRIVTVSPRKGGLGTFAPPLDGAGNSVKGQLVARFLSRRLGLDLFASRPEQPGREPRDPP